MSLPSQSDPPPIRLVLVEDHDMVAEAIGMALAQGSGVEVAARCRSLESALATVAQLQPDVVLLDRRLPDGDGIATIRRLRDAAPSARVLVLTGEATASMAARVAEAGGAGLLLKSSGLQELAAAVRRVATGGVVFSPDLLAGVLDRLTGRVTRSGDQLTDREHQTLMLLADGLSTDEIAKRMGVARNTVRNHVQRVLDKLGARSKLEAVANARRDGLID